MSIKEFEDIALTVCVSGLIGLMLFIVWDMAKSSKAGRYGTFVLFFSLGLGIVSFVAKEVITSALHI
ncbi:MAG: DUF2788 domain-containing protein [Gammaproteobacteria bacterium]